MIDLYSWPTPNGYKISILLEETGLPYTAHAVDILKGDQFEPGFLKISPNNKIPAIVDTEGPDGGPYSVFESGAILLYLAEKTGQFIAPDAAAKFLCIQWLMFQMGGTGPMMGQAAHFWKYAPEDITYAKDRYRNEGLRLFNVMDRRLGEEEFLAGPYSIADIANFPWVRSFEDIVDRLDEYPNLKRWYAAIDARPAVVRGLQVLTDRRVDASEMDEDARDIFFGATQYQRR